MDDFRSNPDARIEAATPDPADEALVTDPRGNMSPAQMVERKLATLMQAGSLPVSRFQPSVLPRDMS
jgi:hypothetical protein